MCSYFISNFLIPYFASSQRLHGGFIYNKLMQKENGEAGKRFCPLNMAVVLEQVSGKDFRNCSLFSLLCCHDPSRANGFALR